MRHSRGQCSTTGTQLVHGKEGWSVQPGAGRRSISASILWQGNAMLGSKQSSQALSGKGACPLSQVSGSAGHRSWLGLFHHLMSTWLQRAHTNTVSF